MRQLIEKYWLRNSSMIDTSNAFSNMYNLKNILAYNQQLQEKEYEEQINNIFPAVLNSTKHRNETESNNYTGFAHNIHNPTHSSSVQRTNTRK